MVGTAIGQSIKKNKSTGEFLQKPIYELGGSCAEVSMCSTSVLSK
jgi:hypothetical protein